MLSLSYIQFPCDKVHRRTCIEILVEVVEVLNEVRVTWDGDSLIQTQLYLWEKPKTCSEEPKEDRDNGDFGLLPKQSRGIGLADEALKATFFVNTLTNISVDVA